MKKNLGMQFYIAIVKEMIFSQLQLHIWSPSSSTSCVPMLQRGQQRRCYKKNLISKYKE